MKMELNIGTIQDVQEAFGHWIIIAFLFGMLCLMFIFWQREHYKRCRTENELLELMGVEVI